jgi:hypothetical protein
MMKAKAVIPGLHIPGRVLAGAGAAALVAALSSCHPGGPGRSVYAATGALQGVSASVTQFAQDVNDIATNLPKTSGSTCPFDPQHPAFPPNATVPCILLVSAWSHMLSTGGLESDQTGLADNVATADSALSGVGMSPLPKALPVIDTQQGPAAVAAHAKQIVGQLQQVENTDWLDGNTLVSQNPGAYCVTGTAPPCSDYGQLVSKPISNPFAGSTPDLSTYVTPSPSSSARVLGAS